MTKSWALILLACAAASGSSALNAPGLDRLIDSFVRDQLSRLHIAGAVVVVVHDGELLLSRGYGFADLANRIPMSAGQTLVRPASISKLFTAIAVLQLVSQGKLDLDSDVNQYLDFHVPTPPGRVPVTLRLLLTHRAGFEDHLKELFTAGALREPLGAWVRRSLPPRLFPNGEVPAYSNYGYALAGYIVARSSGESFEDYAAAHILKPLGMDQSTFQQPPPAALASLLSRAYPQSGAPPLPYFETIPAPAGGLSTIAADMARFLLALLKADGLEGAGLAYERSYAAGNCVLGKHGLTTAVVSDLELLPEARFGLFVSYNSATAGGASTDLLRAIAERYFPHEPPPAQALATAPADAASVAGAYQMSQRAESNFLRLRSLLQELAVVALPDGRILFAGGPQPLRETAPLVFEGAHDLKVAFRKGGVTAMTVSAMPLAMEWERVPWYLDRRLVVPAIVASVAVMAVAMLFWIASAVWRKRSKPSGKSLRRRRDYFWFRGVVAIDLLVVAGTIAIPSSLDLTKLNASLDPWIVLIYALAWLGVLGSPLAVWITFRFWRDRVGGLRVRINQTLLGVSVLIFAWFCIIWRIAGTTLNY